MLIGQTATERSGPAIKMDRRLGTAPRDIWHWVQTPPDLLGEARRIAKIITNFVTKEAYPGDSFQIRNRKQVHNAHLFGRYLWHRFNVEHDDGSREIKARMFGVLRGRSGPRTTYLYAISGDGGRDFGDWCPPLNLGKNPETCRTIRGFNGTDARYLKARAPFDTSAVAINWKQLGHCAAPKLLHAAMEKRLTDLEMVEVWIDPNDRFAWAAVAGTLRHRLGLELYR